MKRILFSLLLLLPFLSSAQNAIYSRVKIHLGPGELSRLQSTGIDINQVNPKEKWVISEISNRDLDKVKKAGFDYEILIEDVQRFYLERNTLPENQVAPGSKQSAMSEDWPVPVNFSLGTCGGFHTVDAMLEQLDQMRALFPNLITVKQLVNDTLTTVEGRPVYYVKISDNPDIAESEPQVLYTGMHHAREPIGMQHLLYYMWYLLENYSTDSDIKDVVDNTEMYFIPIINVDGYQYNIDTYPAGGGMWRKNRRNSGGGNFGIDLNRNYGYMWGYDDEGSSPDPSAENYRGPSPFSEPETRILKYFCETHNFRITLNYHSYSNLLLYVWGWTPDPSPDELLQNTYASIMTAENNYIYGPGSTTIYPTNGGSDDWMYGEQTTKPKIFSYTPEVGNSGDGFWPVQSRIIPLCKENMHASFMAARLVGKYGKIYDASPLFIWQDNGYIRFDVKRLGLQDGDFTASVLPLGDGFASVGSPVILSGMQLLEKRTDSIAYQLAPLNHVGDTLRYLLVLDNGNYSISDTVMRIYGYPYPVFTDNLNNKNNWTGTWNLTGTSWFSPPTSMTDSPMGNYGSNANRSTTLINAIPLSQTLLTVLEFRARWALETDYDYVQLKISSNNGSSWTPLSGRYTNPGTGNQLYGQPLYDGQESEWVHEAISLNPWQDQNIKLRFTLDSDGNTELDGFYFDDVIISNLLDPTAINEPNPAQAWLGVPFPNPANDEVRMSYLIPDKALSPLLKVFDASFREVILMPLNTGQGWAEFSVSGWPSGVYFIRLEAPGLPVLVRKLVVY